jgi:hypothetical protein
MPSATSVLSSVAVSFCTRKDAYSSRIASVPVISDAWRHAVRNSLEAGEGGGRGGAVMSAPRSARARPRVRAVPHSRHAAIQRVDVASGSTGGAPRRPSRKARSTDVVSTSTSHAA